MKQFLFNFYYESIKNSTEILVWKWILRMTKNEERVKKENQRWAKNERKMEEFPLKIIRWVTMWLTEKNKSILKFVVGFKFNIDTFLYVWFVGIIVL